MIKISIDCKKISKERLAKGQYLNAVLIDRPDDYGNDGFIAEDVTKEEREAGTKGKIIGNWKHLGGKKPQQPPQKPAAKPTKPADPDLDGPEDSIPF